MMWVCYKLIQATNQHVDAGYVAFKVHVELFTTEHSAVKFANDNEGFTPPTPTRVRHRYKPSASSLLEE